MKKACLTVLWIVANQDFILNTILANANILTKLLNVSRQCSLTPTFACLSLFVCLYECTICMFIYVYSVCVYVCMYCTVCMHACMYVFEDLYMYCIDTWVCIFMFTALSNGSTKSGVQRMTNDQIFLKIHFMCYVFVSLHCPSQSSWNLGRPRSWTWNRYLGNWCVGFYHVSMSSIWIYHNKHFSKVNPFVST